jgi:hypothetical protein
MKSLDSAVRVLKDAMNRQPVFIDRDGPGEIWLKAAPGVREAVVTITGVLGDAGFPVAMWSGFTAEQHVTRDDVFIRRDDAVRLLDRVAIQTAKLCAMLEGEEVECLSGAMVEA